MDYVGIKIERLGEEGGEEGPYESFYSWTVLGEEALITASCLSEASRHLDDTLVRNDIRVFAGDVIGFASFFLHFPSTSSGMNDSLFGRRLTVP